ncbi:uncharacterized protein LOC115584964 isoform X1 [Sparus aurata]|uniref:uncharacterized protein LOC115584964 isoform X1 n=1 Tax=Sparus aurata TaxID=8175 RepID=UPI0011C1B595|nr:uncharacterized protein LOC115584964 isoform X1 [Sparus aurata]
MNIHHVLFFCLISALCGDTGLVSAKLNIFTGAEGGNGSITCYPSLSGNKKFFCKKECKADGILVKTKGVRAQNGRFSIKYRTESGRGVLTVTITNLTKSDAGRYRSGLGTGLIPDSYRNFEIRVSDELPFGNTGFVRTDIEGENITFGCSGTVYSKQKFLCKDECKTEDDIIIKTGANKSKRGRYSIEYIKGSTFGLYVTITNVSKSDTGWYKCGYGRALSPDSSYTFSIFVIGDPSKPNRTPPPFSTSVPSASTPTTQSLNLSSTSFTTSSSFPGKTNQSSAADPSKTNRTPPPFSSSVQSASTPTTQSLNLSSTSFTTSSSFPRTTNQPSAANPSKTNRTPPPFSSSVPTASTPTTQSLNLSSTSFTTSSSFPRTTNQPSAAMSTDPTKPNRTPPPFSTSVPSASTTTTQSLNLSSRSLTPLLSFPKTANQPSAAVCSSVPHPGYIWGLVVLLVVLLVVVSVLILCIWKMRRDFRSSRRYTEIPVTDKDLAPASTCEDSAARSCSD